MLIKMRNASSDAYVIARGIAAEHPSERWRQKYAQVARAPRPTYKTISCGRKNRDRHSSNGMGSGETNMMLFEQYSINPRTAITRMRIEVLSVRFHHRKQ